MFKTMVIADSRGAGLQKQLNRMLGEGRAEVFSYPGAGIVAAVESAMTDWEHAKYQNELVVLMAGICDVTFKNRRTGALSINRLSEGQIVGKVFGEVLKAYERLIESGYRSISIATITGIDLEDYNNPNRRHMSADEYMEYCDKSKLHNKDQEVVNNAVLEVNRQITGLNRNNNMPTTWTASVVHSYFRGAYHHYYRKLKDGCHPTEETKEDWAKKIAATSRQISTRHQLSQI